MTELSIIIPCYHEEKNIDILYQELNTTLKTIEISYEIIFVDDGSKDKTYEKIERIAQNDDRVSGISFSRNFGHQIALLAGLEKAKGNMIITMDGDMQHPPKVIPQLISKFKEGYDIVNTQRIDDSSISFFKKQTSKWFYKIINRLSDIEVESLGADFRLMSRETVNAFLSIREHDRFTRGLVSWIGYKQGLIEYQAHPRHAGTSSYTTGRMLKLALNGITSMSSKPLRISLFFGLFFFASGILYSLFILYNYFTGSNVQGWTSILITILILGGIQLFILSIIGEYVSKIFNESKARPLYIIKKRTDTD